jgi:hypothetical protein
MSAISEVKRMPQTAAEMESMFNVLVNELDVASAYQRAEVMTYLNLITKLTDKLKKVEFIKDTMIRLAQDNFEVNGFKVEPHVSTTYKYDHDTVWSDLKNQLENREKLMKAAMAATIYDEEGVEITAAIRTTNESFKLTLKKQ